MNGSVESIIFPAPFYDTELAWTENILVPSPHWKDGVRVGDWDWGTQPGVLVRSYVPCGSVIPARPTYLPRSPPENGHATAPLSQNVLYAHHIGPDGRFI